MTETAVEEVRAAGRWARALDTLNELDPVWAEQYSKMAISPWSDGALSARNCSSLQLD